MDEAIRTIYIIDETILIHSFGCDRVSRIFNCCTSLEYNCVVSCSIHFKHQENRNYALAIPARLGNGQFVHRRCSTVSEVDGFRCRN